MLRRLYPGVNECVCCAVCTMLLLPLVPILYPGDCVFSYPQAPILCILAAVEAFQELNMEIPVNLQVIITWHSFST